MADDIEKLQAAGRAAFERGDVELARKAAAEVRRLQSLEQPETTVGGMAKSFGAGVVRGGAALMDTPGAIANWTSGKAIDWAMGKGIVSEGVGNALKTTIAKGPLGSGSTISDSVRDLTGGATDYRGDTFAEKVAGTAGEFAPGAVTGGGGGLVNTARNFATFALAPAVASEMAGDATSGMRFPDDAPLVGGQSVEPYARAGAALVAPMGVRGVERAITPNPTDPARIAAADRLKDEGVTVTAGQRTGNKPLGYRESMAQRTTRIADDQKDQFTAAALKRIGVEANRATPEVMDAAADTIGAKFSGLAARNDIKPDLGLADDIMRALRDYEKLTNKSNLAPLVQNIHDKVLDAAQSGQLITGKQYQQIRSDLSKATKSGDGPLRNASIDLIKAFDDAMARAIKATGNPADIKAYSAARREWRDYLAIQDAVSQAGEQAALGIVTPLRLRSATARQGKSSYAQGKRDLGNLARDGAAVMAPLPQSGTQPRLEAMSMLSGGAPTAGVAGGATYLLSGDPTLSAMAGLAGASAPYVRNALAASGPGQAYLGNQLIAGGDPLTRMIFAPMVELGQK